MELKFGKWKHDAIYRLHMLWIKSADNVLNDGFVCFNAMLHSFWPTIFFSRVKLENNMADKKVMPLKLGDSTDMVKYLLSLINMDYGKVGQQFSNSNVR